MLKKSSIIILTTLFLVMAIQKAKSTSAGRFASPVAGDKILGSSQKLFLPSQNILLPLDQVNASTQKNAPEIEAPNAFVWDLSSDQIIYAKNVREKRPIASLTKIMTALVSLEHSETEQKFIVSEKAAKVGEDSMGLSAGEKLTLQDLLYGLMLPSGNDAADTIAEGVGGNVENFVSMMNEKVKLLGLQDTHFTNPSGLDGDGQHYSTAYDMAVISAQAWKNFPTFRQIVGTYEYDIAQSEEHKSYTLYNETNLLTSYPGVVGIKPGYTPDAGLCLVTLAQNGGHRILAVLLGSNDRRGEMRSLLDYAFAVQGVTLAPH